MEKILMTNNITIRPERKIMKKMYIVLVLAAIWLCGCSKQEQPNEQLTEQNIEIISEDVEDDTEEITKYIHGDTGYFSLINEGYGTSVKTQDGGTCWVTAASTSMESAYRIKNGEEIEIDPLDILECVYGPDKEEGYIIKNSINKLGIGGWAWQIVETLSNGFGKYLLVEAEDYTQVDNETIKEKIREKGAMNVAVNDAKSSLFGSYAGYKTLNDPDSEDFDHEVTIVGWDDNFPKEFFNQKASQNGAWLCQNSRSAKWGNDGYYWVSYDTQFREQTIFVLSNEYQRVLSYDGGNENSINLGDSTTVANVFSAQGELKAVGTYTKGMNQNIIIRIYDDKFNEVLYEKEMEFEIPGYHTVYLDETIDVNDYAISITYYGDAPVEGEAWEDKWITYSVGINEGESFVLMDGEWLDLSNSETIDKLGIDFKPNNCCIKAIY